MCAVDWSAIADWISAIATAITAVLAAMALTSWRAQLSGTAKHAAASELEVAARALRYAFYEARSPLYAAWEFPASYHERRLGETPSNDLKANEYDYVYRNRRKELWPHLRTLVLLRPKAGSVLGDEIAKTAEDLARKARELTFLMDEHVAQLRAGDALVRRWTDQDFVMRVKQSVTASESHNDPLSTEFEAVFKKLIELVSHQIR
jgi:hypothetical protein